MEKKMEKSFISLKERGGIRGLHSSKKIAKSATYGFQKYDSAAAATSKLLFILILNFKPVK